MKLAKGPLAAKRTFGWRNQRVVKRYSVVERNVSPGRRIVAGKWGWLTESGKCWVSRQKKPTRPITGVRLSTLV